MTKEKLLIWSVNLGLIAAVAVLAWIFGPSVFVEAEYQVKQQARQEAVVSPALPVRGFAGLMYSLSGFSQVLEEAEPLIAPVSVEFGLVIPKIFANVAVAENVNPSDPTVYQTVLKQAGGVAHAAGSAVPGELGTIYIFGHSTDASFNVDRFNAVFYLLKKLEPADEIIAYYQGRDYRYQVIEKKTVEPTDISDITDVAAGESRLVLQTCWPPGTTWKRLLVIAEPV